MKKSRKEEKWIQEAEDFRLSTGIFLQNQDYAKILPSERFFVCLLRGFLIFLALFGITGLFITSLELTCNAFLIYLVEFVISMLVALLYYHKWLFNIGYILFFILFCIIAFYFMAYANSGFNAILNQALALVDEKLNLGGYREYTETISDRYVSITVCLILISFLGVCFFNSSISSYMNPTYLFLQLFPLVQICLYLDDSVNYFYIAVLILCWLSVFLIRRSGTYRINLNRKQELFFQCKEKAFQYRQKSIRKSMTGVLVSGIVFGVLFIGLTVGIAKLMPTGLRNNQSAMKSSTDRVVGEFAMNGLWGFFNTFQGTGGVNGGKLGGVRQVTMDFETDLIVNYVPYSLNATYLKGYVGEQYTGTEWKQLKDYQELYENPYYFEDFSELVNKESNLLRHRFEQGGQMSGKGKMQIINLDANTDYYYMPYYTQVNPSELIYAEGEYDLLKGDIVASETPLGRTYTLTYYPLLDESRLGSIKLDAAWETARVERRYRKYVYEHYLQIPGGIRSDLEKICKAQNFHGSSEEIISQIQQYFYDNFMYSLSPGKTPSKRDFVLYFLTKQKRGYCTHFASAGAMLLRSMGIPARYVEGYCFLIESVVDTGVLQEENASDWYEGDSYLTSDASEQRVLSVDVTDSSAHAWVEVYIDGFGWVPVEFTTARTEERSSGESFWEQFANFFNGGDEDEDTSPMQLLTEQMKDSVPYLFAIGFLLFDAVILFWYGKRLVRIYCLYYRRNKKRLVSQYQAMTLILKKYHFTEQKNLYHGIAEEILTQKFSVEAADAAKYRRLVETASYGQDTVSEEELRWCTGQFKQFIRKVKAQVNRKERLLLTLKY